MLADRREKRSPRVAQAEDVCAAFEASLVREESLLYGAALYFECVRLLFDGDDALLETNRKELRNLIQSGREALKRAGGILADVRAVPAKRPLLEQFEFTTFDAHPDPAGMRLRAELLVQAYASIFPKRARELEFTDDEVLQLLDQAAARLAASEG